jgi:hypothetical protein
MIATAIHVSLYYISGILGACIICDATNATGVHRPCGDIVGKGNS